ncbi:hypothetical protein A3K89_13480 [Rhodococcoides kyotonense]|uniref:Uncharacterized protein n=1 Tax=Rhodococcoides kyotonense TaxID=398843 RepID=A0A177Y739_9NOCA|nr:MULTISPECIES: hypothetical protein [Rhodococcus]OAK51220.1 hypothetical protein A3K89_13480 [Rhodococcus kyotonensis]
MKHVFDLAKANAHLDLETVRDLLRSRWFESRMVAVSILDARARRKALGDPERKHLYEDPAARLVSISESVGAAHATPSVGPIPVDVQRFSQPRPRLMLGPQSFRGARGPARPSVFDAAQAAHLQRA